MLADLLDAENQADTSDQDDPPEGLHKRAEPHDDTSRQRERDSQAGKQVGEDRHHKLEQRAHDQDSNRDHGHRIDQRRLDRRPQAHGFFDVGRQSLQNDVENTAGFSSLDHVGSEVVEDVGILAHSIGQRRAPFHRGANPGQRFLKRLVLLVGRKDFQALHQRQTGIDHDRELAEENRDVLGLNLARSKRGQSELFAFFADCPWGNALAPQVLRQHLFVRRHPLPGDLLSGCILAGKCKDWHGFSFSLLTCRRSLATLYCIRPSRQPPTVMRAGSAIANAWLWPLPWPWPFPPQASDSTSWRHD